MKILFIQLSGRGGTQLYTAQLANAVSKNSKDSNVYVLLGNNLFEDKLYDDKLNIFTINSPISYIKMLLLTINPLTYYDIIKQIKQIEPDIIHITYEFLWDSLSLKFLKKYPVVVTIHDPTFHTGTNIIVRLYLGISRQLIKTVYDKAIVHGKILKIALVKQGFREKDIEIIPHGEYSYYTKWQKEGVVEDRAILFFGTIRDYKGIEYLIKAEPIITSAVPGTKIIIAGAGDFKKYESMMINKGSFEVINKHIPDEDVSELFQKSQIVVLPYIDASQTGVIPVAFAFKKPVIATTVGSIPEIVEEGITGLLVPPQDHIALANAIIKLLKDDALRRKIGYNGFIKTKKELAWTEISVQTMNLYQEVIERKKQRYR